MAYDPTTQTVTIGLRYIGNQTMDLNLRKIDAAFAQLGLTPPAEPPAAEPTTRRPAEPKR